ncbi:MAG: acyltransferase [Sterolibacteriaceae bacterium MAG5]|nr:acyltransferase [Candidatus Nitricoxidireducens bremensis]
MTSNLLPDYRPDIDGLRAVAVLSVVAFHAFPEWVHGGFVGVDVFFVISGFLISTIILRSLDAGDFSFADFYARRIKRIFPALALVLAASLALGWSLLLKDELRQLGGHTAAGAAFLSNFVLMRESGYFDTAVELKPLLHLWSLAIEEQFYLIWPLALFLAYRYRRNPLTVILLVLAVSFALNAGRAGGRHAVQTFYHPLTRFWELLAGGALAWIALHRHEAFDAALRRLLPEADRQSALQDTKSFLGIGLVAAGVFLLDRSRAFPGWWALLPVLGAFLLISAGPHAAVNRRLLAHPVFVFVGLISYPLYLWHWPLLSFARIVIGETPSAGVRIALVALSVLLAFLTYRFVEKPIRAPRPAVAGHDAPRSPAAIVAVLTAAVAILGIAGLLIQQGSLGGRLKTLDAISDAKDDWDYPRVSAKDRHPQYSFHLRPLPGRSDDTLLFLGDSNVEQFYPRVRKLHEDSGRAATVVFVTAGGCSPIPEIEQTDGGCAGQMKDAFAYAAETSIRKVVIGATWDYFDQTKYTYAGSSPIPRRLADTIYRDFAARLKGLVAAGKEVYLVLPVPKGPPMDPQRMVDLQARFTGIPRYVEPLRVADFVAQQQEAIRLLNRVAAESGAKLLDPLPDVCDADVCPNLAPDGRPVSKDAGHLRPFYVAERIRMFDALFSQPVSR